MLLLFPVELNSLEAEQSFHNFNAFILPSTCSTVTIDWRFLNSIANCKYIKQLRIMINGPISGELILIGLDKEVIK